METESKKEDPKPITDDDIQSLIGGIGRFHLLLILVLLPCTLPTVLQPLGIVFLAPPVNYTCIMDFEAVGDPPCPCDSPEYDTTIFQETMITKWDLICDRAWLISLPQFLIQLGSFVGSVVFGALSDKFGRRPILLATIILQIVAGISASFTPDFWTYIILRFFVGVALGGILIVTFVLLLEFTGRNHRELMTCLSEVQLPVGYLLLPLLGYYIKSWFSLNLSYGVTSCAVIILYWILPESPRWLLTAGKTEESIKTFKFAAKINNLPTDKIDPMIRQFQLENNREENSEEGTIVDLFSYSNMRKNIICVMVNWLVCNMGFYGLSQYIGKLNGDIFINVGIAGGMTAVGLLTIYVSLSVLPRRVAVITMNLITSTSLLVIAMLPKSWAWATVIMACIGNVGAYAGLIIFFLYTTEMFPTVVRNAAMGIASMAAGAGAMLAPFIVLLNDVVGPWLPPIIFGIAPLLGSILCFFLPETKNCVLPNTLDEGENFGKRRRIEDT